MLIKSLQERQVLYQLSVCAPVELVITQVDDHVKSSLTSELIKGIFKISRVHFLVLIKSLQERQVLYQLSVCAPVELVITQVDDHVKSSLTSELIKGISRVLQKLLKYFSGTIILTSFSLLSSGVFPVILILDLNDLESARLSSGSSLKYCHKFPHVFT